ncbi:MAG: hypothetical protein JO250_06930 [Armatimonadetes bacterium]|nr:hypothetical protein [Armatimonadota bacterium]
MTIMITPETEAWLREKAEREGRDVSAVADAMLRTVLEWEARGREEEIEAIRRGLEAVEAGRTRPFAEFAAEMRAKYDLPTHLSDEELIAPN